MALKRQFSVAPFLLSLTLLIFLEGVDVTSSTKDIFEKCCELGDSWAENKLRCEKFTGPVPGVEETELEACYETVDICCRKAYQRKSCDRGKADAKAGLSCVKNETGSNRSQNEQLADYQRDCCEGCKLGILTGSSGKGCAFKKISLGIPWDPAFEECCAEVITDTSKGTLSTVSTNGTTPTTSSSIVTSSESDELDDIFKEDTDFNPATSFNSDDLCQLMKGLLCSEICVPTPGSYYCKCQENSILQEDGRTCKSNLTSTQTPIVSLTTSTSTPNINSISDTSKFLSTDVDLSTSSDSSSSTKSTSELLNSTLSLISSSQKTTSKISLKSTSTIAQSTSAIVQNSTKHMSPIGTLKLLTLAKSRTTRSLSTENNELNLPCPLGYRYNPSSEVCDDIDECTEGSHDCGNQKCYNLPGTYQCAQLPTPVIRRKTSTTPQESTRTTVNSGDNCSVGSRYDTSRGGGCVDVDECKELEDACSSNEDCVNSPGSFRCVCKTGFRRDELTQACVDINECQLENDCLSSQRCDNTIGSYACVRFLPCGTGYTLNAATEICEDDDECILGIHDCPPNYHCRNTLGSYRCDKDRGKTTTTSRPTTRRTLRPTYTTFRSSTTAKPTTTSTPKTTTTSRPRIITTTSPRTTYKPIITTTSPRTTYKPIITTTSPRTTYKPTINATSPRITYKPIINATSPRTTYKPIITTSSPTTTSTTKSTITTRIPNSTTTSTTTTTTSTTETIPTVGSLSPTIQYSKVTTAVRRSCPRGFESGPVGQCIDINECQRNSKMCGNMRCINTIGSYRCEPRILCAIGYAPDPVSGQCKDIDECLLGVHKCGPEQKCENRPGRYACYCPPGYEIGGNHDCIDVDECKRFSYICDNGRCFNTPGSYRCLCDPGFENDAGSVGCRDVDECVTNPGLCQQDCYNTIGSYRCGCLYGFRLKSDNRTCEDIDECAEFKSSNLCIGICDNTPGSYACRCPDGYLLGRDGRTCQDIDECATGNVCSSEELCQNVRGGYRCNKINCPPGYILDSNRKNRCVRESPFCPVRDQACFLRPAHYTYNYIAIVSMYPIPQSTGKVDVFTMRGTYELAGSTARFNIAFIKARAPPHVIPATESCFALHKPYPTHAVLVMTRSLQGPQDIELEFSMEIYGPTGAFAGSAVAKIFIIVTQYEF